MTPGGVYPLKFFFNEGMKHESGEDVSTREIQSALKDIIEHEDKKSRSPTRLFANFSTRKAMK